MRRTFAIKFISGGASSSPINFVWVGINSFQFMYIEHCMALALNSIRSLGLFLVFKFLWAKYERVLLGTAVSPLRERKNTQFESNFFKSVKRDSQKTENK